MSRRHGYGDAILIEMLKLFDVIETNDPSRMVEYSAKNMGDAVMTANICEQWLQPPLIQLKR